MTLKDGTQAKAKLYNFKTSRLDTSYTTDIEAFHLCFANCKRPSELFDKQYTVEVEYLQLRILQY